jgi:hypothetical protein
VKRYVSDPIPHPETHGEGEGTEIGNAELVFYDVDPTGDSYQARVFLNAPDADHTTPTEDERFAGWFTVFGHGGCFGDDEDHCAPPPDVQDPFDVRFPVGIPRQTKKVRITQALRALGPVESFTVTVVAVVPGENGPQEADVLDFRHLRLLTFEETHAGEAAALAAVAAHAGAR